MEWLFVLRGDKPSTSKGWWLKIQTVEELVEYFKEVNPTRYGNVFENYIYGKEFNAKSVEHMPHHKEANLTYGIVMQAERNGQTILQGIQSFQLEVALRCLDDIREYGAIYFNRVGGRTFHYEPTNVQYAFVRRKQLVWPDFKHGDIRVKQFSGGEHFYAYVDDVQVRDGSTCKWDTYSAAYNHALSYISNQNVNKETKGEFY